MDKAQAKARIYIPIREVFSDLKTDLASAESSVASLLLQRLKIHDMKLRLQVHLIAKPNEKLWATLPAKVASGFLKAVATKEATLESCSYTVNLYEDNDGSWGIFDPNIPPPWIGNDNVECSIAEIPFTEFWAPRVELEKRLQSIRESTETGVFAEAQEYLNLRLTELCGAEAKVVEERPKRTFNEAAARYILENGHKRSLSRDDLAIRTVMPFIGDVDIRDIHYGKLKVYVENRLREGITNATINRDMASVRAVLKAASTQWFDDNGQPWLVSIPSLPRLKVPKAGIRAITLKEQKALIREMPDYLAEMTLFTVNTGLRRGEVTALRWEWEVQDYPAFILPAEAHKTGDHSGDKLVVCNSTAWSIVNSLRGQHPERVFPKVTFMGRAWRKAREKASLGSVRVHDLRHTFSTRLRAAGVSEDDRADLLGHSNPRMTRHYSAPDITRLLEAAEKVVKMTHEPVLRVVGR